MQLDSCIRTNEESIQLQQATMQMLREQEQTIDSIENKLQIVDANNKKSEHIVNTMGSRWGWFKNLIGVKPKDTGRIPSPIKHKPVDPYPTY